MATVVTGTIDERSGCVLLARLTGDDGDPIVQSDVSSAAYEVWDINDTPAIRVTAATSLTVANVVYNTLQTDARWTKDDTGYNFAMVLPADSVPDAHKYRVDVQITPAAGQVFFAKFELSARKTYFGDPA